MRCRGVRSGGAGPVPLLRDCRLLLSPGDRSDVVMAACLAAVNGVRLAGLLLTAGIEPDPEVTRLTAAAAATGLPILVVDELTYPTRSACTLHPDVPRDDADRARTVADALDPAWIQALPGPGRLRRLTPAASSRRVRAATPGSCCRRGPNRGRCRRRSGAPSAALPGSCCSPPPMRSARPCARSGSPCPPGSMSSTRPGPGTATSTGSSHCARTGA
jgi:hypothetical protein